MKIIHNSNEEEKPKRKLGDIQKSLGEIQSLINSHWSDSESNYANKQKKKSLFKKLLDVFRSEKKDNVEIIGPLFITNAKKYPSNKSKVFN